jgi:hypothetical protein
MDVTNSDKYPSFPQGINQGCQKFYITAPGVVVSDSDKAKSSKHLD